MKRAATGLFAVLSVLGLCSCATLPNAFEDSAPMSREEAISQQYAGFRSHEAADVGTVYKLNSLYTPNW